MVLRSAYSSSEVGELNDFFAQTQRRHPRAWGLRGASAREGFVSSAGRIYSQPLLDHPELDRFTRHPSSFPLVARLLGEPRYSEFNLRESPAGAGPLWRTMRYHHDRALPSRLLRPAHHPVDDVCAIHYLTDVSAETPAFLVVPGSGQCTSLQAARDELGDAYVEQPIYGPAGTCVLYDIAIWHTRLDGSDPRGRVRRTVHQYFARGGWLGKRPPSPPLTDWNLIPRRLAQHADKEARRFFSHWNTAMCEWAADDWSMEGRARHPRAVGALFEGFDSRAEQEAYLEGLRRAKARL